MTPTRRRLFQGAGATLALGLVGGVGWLATGPAPSAGARPVALSRAEYAIVEALVEGLLPEEPGLPSGLRLGVPARCDEELWCADERIAGDLKLALRLIELAPLRLGFGSRLSRLAPARREDAVRAMLQCSNGLFVKAASAWRQLVHVVYYAHEGAWAGVGYDGPWVEIAVPPASASAYAAAVRARYGAGA